MELWAPRRSGKGQGSYAAYDYRMELEYGFTDRLKGALCLNAGQHHVSGCRASAILSVYKDPLGLTLYVEPQYSRYSGASGERRNSEFARSKNGDHVQGEAVLGFSSGIAYHLAPGWFGGAEMVYRSVWPGLGPGSRAPR